MADLRDRDNLDLVQLAYLQIGGTDGPRSPSASSLQAAK
jgi:hypothetical protein